MREKQQYKTVTIEYIGPRRKDWIDLVTDVEYHESYILLRYHETLDRLDTKIIAMTEVDNIQVNDMDYLDAERAKMFIAERTAGTDFEKIRFFPYNNDVSRVTIVSYRKIDHTEFRFDRVFKMERKWDHDLSGHKILIYTVHKDAGLVWSGIDAIYVFAEDDIKLMVIERTGMEKIKVNVNGGKYDND